MSTIIFTNNQGSQSISFAYNEDAVARLFNKIFDKTLPPGLYSGGALARASNTTVSIAPYVALVEDANATNIAARIETTTSTVLDLATIAGGNTFDATKPYLVIRFGWADQVNCYANIIPVAFSSNPSETDPTKILPTDVVLGKVIADSSGSPVIISASTPFDTTRQNAAFLVSSEGVAASLKVSSSEASSTKVYVSSGIVATGLGLKTVAGGDYPTAGIANTVNGRYDIVWIDDAGAVQVTQGIDSSSPVAPTYTTRRVIAEIRRGAGRTDVKGSDIVQIDPKLLGQVKASEIDLADVGGYITPVTDVNGYSRKDLESAVQQLFSKWSTTDSEVQSLLANSLISSGVSVSTDGTMASNSDLKLPTEKAIRYFVEVYMGKIITFIKYTNGAPQSWTASKRAATIILIGGGGGGGGANNPLVITGTSYAGGGGAGAFVKREVKLTPGTAYSVTIGGGGAGGIAAASGAVGGSSVFSGGDLADNNNINGTITAYGGGGGGGTFNSGSTIQGGGGGSAGLGGPGGTSAASGSNVTPGVAGNPDARGIGAGYVGGSPAGAGSNGAGSGFTAGAGLAATDIDLIEDIYSQIPGIAGATNRSGAGGSCYGLGGQPQSVSAANGNAGEGYGSGGSGGLIINATGSVSGGAGAPGICIIIEE